MAKKKNKKSKAKVSNFPKPKRRLTSIKVIGIGGCGGNIVTRMMEGERMKGVEFVAINTDAQDLDHALAHKKIYIGKALTHGLGAGMNPEIGKQAAEENRSEIGEILNDSDIVFIAAGMGGGTGTGASPIIAEIAKEMGILTIAIVTKPFAFEGTQRMTTAQEGLNRLKDKVDSLVIIPNDRVFSLISKDTPLLKAFAYIDEVLKHAVRGIAEIINAPGIINVDFADIKSVIRDAGTTLIGIGVGSGPDRGMKAVNEAINSPLLEISIEGAKGALFSIAGGRDLRMSEINDIAKAIATNLDSNAKIIFGAYNDRGLKDKSIKVTIIATGFNGIFGQRMSMPSLFLAEEFGRKDVLNESVVRMEDSNEENEQLKAQTDKKVKKEEAKKTEAWEIPTFLRKKRK